MVVKKLISLLLALVCLVSAASAVNFSDVTEKTENHEAIEVLSNRGILGGYPDGTFRPEATVTRAEAAAVIVRMMDYELDDTPSAYTDVANDFWGRAYIMAATREGILTGMGNGRFAPQDPVTYPQYVKMLVCAVGAGDTAEKAGGWPMGYVDTAKKLEIINPLQRVIVKQSMDRPAPRSVVAGYAYATMAIYNDAANSVQVEGASYRMGQSADNLPKADEVLASTGGFMWHVYGTANYQGFHAVGVKDGIIVAIGAEGFGFRYDGYTAGDILPEQNDLTKGLRGDKHDGNKIHGVLLLQDDLWEYFVNDTSEAAIRGEERMNFHCTNAFRVMHGKSILQWSEPCAVAARLHSADMGAQNYFRHDSLDGRKFYHRLEAQGVRYSSCAENIYAGQNLGFSMHDGWVNSAGHRKNILSDQTFLGVGGAYNANSDYKTYFTQDFYKQ